MDKQTYVNTLLGSRKKSAGKTMVSSFAPSNIALVKYWGKRAAELNLPLTSSLSISLADRGTTTSIKLSEDAKDCLIFNGKVQPLSMPLAKRTFDFLNLFRQSGEYFHIETTNTIPTSAGLASSASGFAALVQALDLLYDWQLPSKTLSLLARLGSGSAARSFWHGFVKWQCGEREDGMDSFAYPLDDEWPELCVGLLICHRQAKAISSREAMELTKHTSPYYSLWPKQVSADLVTIKSAIKAKAFEQFGQVLEANALSMHGLMITAKPAILYWQPETVESMRKVWALRKEGVPVYFSEDAGANLKLFFLKKDLSDIEACFPEIEIIEPFSEFIRHD